MSISLYTGRPGSGKTYGVVANIIIPGLEQGRRVVTNVPLKESVIYEAFPDAEIEFVSLKDVPFSYFDFDSNPGLAGSLVVLDEIWRRWPNGKRQDQIPEIEREFFAEHRHAVGADGNSTEIVLVCQSLQQISPFIKELIDTTFISSKLDKVGRKGSYRIDVYSGPQVTTRPDRNMLVTQNYGNYSKDVWRFYTSHTKSSVLRAGKEDRVDGRMNVLTGGMMKVGLPFVLVVGFLGVYFLLDFLTPDREVANVESSPIPTPSRNLPTLAKVQAQPRRVSDQLPISQDWRLAGIIWDENHRGFAIIINTESRTRIIPILGFCSTVPGVNHEWFCKVDGERVTTWSGQSSSNTFL